MIPNSIDFIDEAVFYGCVSLKEITSLHVTPPLVCENTFENVPKSETIVRVLDEAVEEYKADYGWKGFANIVGLGDGNGDNHEEENDDKNEEIVTNLVVWTKDGSKIAYSLAEQPNVTFSGTDMKISTNTIDANYPLSQIVRLTYERFIESTNIINLKGETIRPFDYNGESLVFSSVEEKIKLSIYTTDGKTALNREIKKGDVLTISLASFRTGIYMVKVNGVTYKIAVR